MKLSLGEWREAARIQQNLNYVRNRAEKGDMRPKQFYGQFEPKIDEAAWDILDGSKPGLAIEVGACDGIFFSNTYVFEQHGWNTLAIEPNPEWHERLRKNRKNFLTCAVSDKNGTAELTVYDIRQADHSAITSIRKDERLAAQYGAKEIEKIPVVAQTLDKCIQAWVPSTRPFMIDYVSIDTEGTELDVLKGFDIEWYRPRLMVIENNFNDPDVAKYLSQFRYVLATRIGVNDFFVPEP